MRRGYLLFLCAVILQASSIPVYSQCSDYQESCEQSASRDPLGEGIFRDVQSTLNVEVSRIFDRGSRYPNMVPASHVLKVKSVRQVDLSREAVHNPPNPSFIRIKSVPEYHLSLDKESLYTQYLRRNKPILGRLETIFVGQGDDVGFLTLFWGLFNWIPMIITGIYGGLGLAGLGGISMNAAIAATAVAGFLGLFNLIFIAFAIGRGLRERSRAKEIINNQPDELIYVDQGSPSVREEPIPTPKAST